MNRQDAIDEEIEEHRDEDQHDQGTEGKIFKNRERVGTGNIFFLNKRELLSEIFRIRGKTNYHR